MSVLIDIAIGLIVVFIVFSIVVSGINEWFAQAFARRGQYLRLGMQRLISDDAVYRRVLNHPLIGALYRDAASHGKPPSYVEPSNFALAIADVLTSRAAIDASGSNQPSPLTVDALRSAIAAPAFADSSIRSALLPIIDRAQGDLEAALKGIEAWFSGGMDRVSGWYKARSQKMIFLIGLLLAALANVDTLEIYATLSRSPSLRAQFVKVGEEVVKTGRIGEVDINTLKDRAPTTEEWQSMRPVIEALRDSKERLPIGYSCMAVSLQLPEIMDKAESVPADASPWMACKHEFLEAATTRSLAAWFLKLVGWALTALAGTLGAAYWFGTLTKVINLRGSGTRPRGGSPSKQSDQ